MKILSLLFLGSMVVASCSQFGTKDEDNVAQIQKYISAIENKNYKALTEMLDDKYVGIGPSVSDTLNKQQTMMAFKKNASTLYKSIKYTKSLTFPMTVSEGDYSGDWVSNYAYLMIVYQNGHSVNLLTNTAYKLENGKITNSFTFYNEADALEQMGFVLLDLNELKEP